MLYFKNKYTLNQDTLKYEKIPITPKMIIGFFILLLSLGILMFFILSTFYSTPKEKTLKNKVKTLSTDVYILSKRIDGLQEILSDIEKMDSVVYQSLFDTGPSYRDDSKLNQIDRINNTSTLDLVDYTHNRLNELENSLKKEYYDIKNIQELSIEKQDMLMCVPSIQPISNKDLSRTASGWGMRIHPIYKIKKFHFGLDFAARKGTPVYATGNSKVFYVSYNDKGYGKFIILDHGYGYKTLYGHLDAIHVKIGDKINRGDVIGDVGSTGISTGPHLHYEVVYYGKKNNPINYFFNDLSPQEYDKMIKLSSEMNMTFD